MIARSAMCEIAHSRLLQVLEYQPETGLFLWRVNKGRSKAGATAGAIRTDGYLSLTVDQWRCAAHRVAWFYVHGVWPQHDIDHINGNRTDNRLANLRDVTRSVNLQNQRFAKSHNRLGALGVRKRGKRYAARINDTHLGHFDTSEQAQAAYVTAKRSLHEGCTL